MEFQGPLQWSICIRTSNREPKVVPLNKGQSFHEEMTASLPLYSMTIYGSLLSCDVCAVEVGRAYMCEKAGRVEVPPFKPRSGVTIHTSDEEAKEAEMQGGSKSFTRLVAPPSPPPPHPTPPTAK